ncbi:MAG TPA: carboxy terminal-processing peptidase, partial [Gammaproteobacteria bacterium]
ARDKVKLEEQSAQKKVIDIERGKTTYKVGVIELPTFYVDFQAFWAGDPDYRSSTRDVERLLQELKEEQVDALIIDLRNNGGGSLQEANDLTGLFIPSGPVVQIRNKRHKIETLEDHNPKVAYSGPLAVLVNRLSASASEIFAGAIQDHGRGIVIGSQTFGKGTVQNMKDLTKLESSQLKYTQAMFYRVSGESTQERGIIPDIVFPELLNKEEIGESSLPEALPWDRISPAKYQKLSDLGPVIDQLIRQHEQRVAGNPDFNYLNERLAFLMETRNKTRTSLNEAERLQERELAEKRLLEMENRRRVSKGLEPFKTFAELEKSQESEESRKPPTDVFLLEEAGNILLDWISLTKTQVAVH